jgi:hypothetical protein
VAGPGPGDGQQTNPEQRPALSVLEEALRRALATTAREQVLSCITATLPMEVDTGPGFGPPGRAEAGGSAPVSERQTTRGQASRRQASRRQASKVQKVSVSMPEDLTDLIRSRAGAGGFSRYVTDAVREQVTHDLLGELLDELERDYGPVPAEVREQTRQIWPDQADG